MPARTSRMSLMAVAIAVSTLPLAVSSLPAAAEAGTAKVYIVQGVADSSMAISVDGKTVAADAAAKTIVGPLELAAGAHTVTARNAAGTATVTSTVTVKAGESVDTVVHRQVDPSKPPVVTTYINDLSSVTAGSGRLVVAHTAAVGPADIRVKDKVLFSNIANGEALTLTVPASTYPVEIVPTTATGPVVFGPAQLPVAQQTLTRVFAIGVAATKSMDAVVQTIPIDTRGAGTTPDVVNAGDGGQAESLIRRSEGQGSYAPLVYGAGLAAVGAAAFGIRRRRAATR